jgi:hypothetical protein
VSGLGQHLRKNRLIGRNSLQERLERAPLPFSQNNGAVVVPAIYLERSDEMETEARLSRVWDQHVGAEFSAKSADDAVATMTATAYVNLIPLMIGARGRDQVRDFYADHFVSQLPRTDTRPTHQPALARIVGLRMPAVQSAPHRGSAGCDGPRRTVQGRMREDSEIGKLVRLKHLPLLPVLHRSRR